MPDLSGTIIKGYQLQQLLGEGAYGAVYRSSQPQVGREVALKVILPEYANRPDFIRRFETEAQLVAQLEHLHIVPLYDYWREPGGAYLVMRLMKGGSLEVSLRENGPWQPAEAARLVDQIASALEAAHKQGVVHRDLKPANILLDEAHNAYLSDFGIAKEIGAEASATQTGAIIGTPAYITPEQVQSQPVTAQTDIYALGVVLYELLVGGHPFPDTPTGELVVKHLSEPLPYVRERRAELPAAVDGVIQRATAKDPTSRYPDALSLAVDLRRALGLEVALPEVVVGELTNPYKGLRAFQEADADDFYGREALVGQLLARLVGTESGSRFLAVVGPSGSGKSSVVKAGLLPALRKGALPGSDQWFVTELVPGMHPLEELERALLGIATNPDLKLAQELSNGPYGLLRAAWMALPSQQGEVLLVIDQFEELFLLVADEEKRTHFLELLYTAVTAEDSIVRVVVTLRADFYDRPLLYSDFSALMQKRTEVVIPLTSEELEQAIRAPCERVGAVLEKGLAANIVAEVSDQPGSLPLLQYALTELFECRDGRMLTQEAYQTIGGVLGALGRRAEEVYSGLDAEAQGAARQLFLRLVTLGEGTEDTRRRVPRSELESIFPNIQSLVSNIINIFGQARLLTFDRDPETREPTVEVAHEALLREWRRLRDWLDESRADIRMQRVLGNAASEWLRANREASFLLRGSRLEQFEAWAASTDLALTANEQDFLEASLAESRAREAAEAERQAREAAIERRSRNFLRGLVVVLAVAAIVAVVLSAVAFQQRQAARKQAGILLASQAESEVENGFTDRAILLALEALEDYPYTSQAEHALGEAVTSNKALQLYTGHTAAVIGAAWSADGKRVATSSTDNSIQIWDPTTGENSRVIQLPEGITSNCYDWALAIQWSPDDRYLLGVAGDRFVLGSQDFDLILWDANNGEQVAFVEVQNTTPPPGGLGCTTGSHYSTGSAAAFAGDGRLATLGGDNTALVWAPMLEDQLLVLRGHTQGVNGVAWSPDFQRLVTVSGDGTARIWSAYSGEELIQLLGHSGGVNQAAWSPDGKRVATVGDDGSLRLWEADSGENLTTIQVVPSSGNTTAADLIVWSLAWSPDGRYLATGSGDGYIRVWEVESEQPLLELKGHEAFVTYLAWSPQDDRLVSTSTDGRARIWKITPDNMVFSLPYKVVNYGSGAWSPDGRFLAVGDSGVFDLMAGVVAVWDVDAGRPLFETQLDKDGSWDFTAHYSPDGAYILTRITDFTPTGAANKFYVLDSQTGEIVRLLETGKEDTLLLIPGWSPDGQQVASGDYYGTIYFWEASSGALTRTLNCLTWGHIVEWSPDGDRIAMLCIDYEAGIYQIQVLDAHTYELLLTIEKELLTNPITWISWSPDSTRIAASGGDDEIGTLLNPIYIFDANNGEQLLTITRHTGMVSGVGWSPDGQRIVSGSTDDTTRIWDAETGAELLTLATPTNWQNIPAWSPDGEKLLVAIANVVGEGQSGVFRVWQSTQELVDYAKECCVFRELTSEEREQFGLPPR